MNASGLPASAPSAPSTPSAHPRFVIGPIVILAIGLLAISLAIAVVRPFAGLTISLDRGISLSPVVGPAPTAGRDTDKLNGVVVGGGGGHATPRDMDKLNVVGGGGHATPRDTDKLNVVVNGSGAVTAPRANPGLLGGSVQNASPATLELLNRIVPTWANQGGGARNRPQ